MKLLIEVVATNMDTGHVAINQHTIDINLLHLPPSKRDAHGKSLYENLKKSPHFTPNKVGPILIDRSLLAIL